MTEKELKREYRNKNKAAFIAEICFGAAGASAAVFTAITLNIIGVFVTGVFFLINLIIYVSDELRKSAYIADNIYRSDDKKQY